jgi:hypothetical protein
MDHEISNRVVIYRRALSLNPQNSRMDDLGLN